MINARFWLAGAAMALPLTATAAQADIRYVVNPDNFAPIFSLAVLDPSDATPAGRFGADNYASVHLNGSLIGRDVQGAAESTFESLTPFSASPADFVKGVNSIASAVTDSGPPSALPVTSLLAFAGAVPEPAGWALVLLGFGVLGLAVRSRRDVAAA